MSAVLAAARTPTEHPLLVSTDSQYSWAGACLLGAGFHANPLKEHFDLWRELEIAIRARPVHANVSFEKVKAHTSQEAVGRILTAAQRAGNAGADILADDGAALRPHRDAHRTQAVRRARAQDALLRVCLLYTSPSPRDKRQSRMPSSA